VSIAQTLGISEELFQLMIAALEQALEKLQSVGEAFHPFILVEGGGKSETKRLVAPELEQAVKTGRALIGRMSRKKVRYVLVFDGRVPLDEKPHDAVLVEAGERGAKFGIRVAMYYRLLPTEPGVEQVGNPKPLGRTDNYFANE
jgi:hypothetical protein